MKLKKELGALCCAVVFAYVWQLGLLLLCYVSNPKGDFIQPYMFVPQMTIQTAIVPIMTWVLMGLFQVTWMKKWLKITAILFAFAVPFVLIAMVVLMFINPVYWHKSWFWVVDVLISLICMVTIFKPLLTIKF